MGGEGRRWDDDDTALFVEDLWKASLDAHLILNARLEVSQEGPRFVILDLAELHRAPAEMVVQLRGKDGRRAALVLRALVSYNQKSERTRRGLSVVPFSSRDSLHPENRHFAESAR